MDFARWKVWVAGNRWLRLFMGPGKGEVATRPVKHPGRFRRTVIGTVASNPACGKPPLATWAESFIFAGSSALLLLVANLFPHWWYFSFFALTPFLYKIISAKGGSASGGKAAPDESFRLGFLLGLSFFGASAVNSLFTSPLASVLKLISGTALFALFGWTVGWARQRWGFNPSIVAMLWVGLELGLVKVGFVGGLLGKAEFSQPFFGGLVALFGGLTVSAIIVLLNSLLVLAIVKTLEITRPKGKTTAKDERTWVLFFVRNLFAEKVYLVPESRAPPFLSETVCVIVS
jgi:hypothetical protein